MASPDLFATVARAVASSGRLKVPALEPTHYRTDLADLGVDSMAALGIISEIEDSLGIVVDDRDALKLRNIEAIVGYLEDLVRSAPPPDERGATQVKSLSFSLTSHPYLGSHRIQ
ncbi:MAG: acyl carrier protein [Deltaproteobacteria bacterium]|nr:acyl carrier protein [Deltaproteobacteria bacterium]